MTTSNPSKHQWLVLKNKLVLIPVGLVVLIIIAGLLTLHTHKSKASDLMAHTSTKLVPKKTTTPSPKSTTTSVPIVTTATPAPTTSTKTTTTLPTPAAPTGLIGSAAGPTSISLSWKASVDPGGEITGYDIVRNGYVVGKATATSYTDATVSASTGYTYSIKAVDLDGHISPASTVISVQTPPVFALTLGTGTVSPAPPTQSLLGDPIDFDFPVTANTAGTITYQIVDSYGVVMQSPTTLTFSAAGEQDIALDYVTPESWVTLNDNALSATASLQVLTPVAYNSNAVAFDWANF